MVKHITLHILGFLIAIAASGCKGAARLAPEIGTTPPVVTTAPSGTAELEWSTPTQNDDESPLTDLAGYKVKYGTSPGVYTSSLNVGKVNKVTVQDLAPNTTYYFAVSAVNSTADESPASNEMSKTTPADGQ